MSAFCHKIGASVKKADAPEALLNMNCLRTRYNIRRFTVIGNISAFGNENIFSAFRQIISKFLFVCIRSDPFQWRIFGIKLFNIVHVKVLSLYKAAENKLSVLCFSQ